MKNGKVKSALFVLYNFDLGGAERQAFLLARYMKDELKYNVRIVAFSGPGVVTELCRNTGIACEIIPFEWTWKRAQLLNRLMYFAYKVRLIKPDYILPYTALPNIVCGLIWKLTGAKACVWNQRDAGFHLNTGKMHRWAIMLCSHVISNSQIGADFLSANYHIPEKKLHVINNGVETLEINHDSTALLRKNLGLSRSSFVAIMVANLHSNKDHKTLLLGWKKFVDTNAGQNQARLLLAGSYGDAYYGLKDIVQKLDLQESVMFLGAVSDIGALLPLCQLGILSSRAEGCPNALLECMAAGLPVIGTNIPGIREAVGPRNYRYLAGVGDADGLAQLISDFSNDEQLRIESGQYNKQRVEEEFSVEKMCKKTMALLCP